jgi:hypothetical protein
MPKERHASRPTLGFPLNVTASFAVEGGRESRYIRIRRVAGANIILSGFEIFDRFIGEE